MKYSKEGQDQFALLCRGNCIAFKSFLDLGSAHPTDGNNTVRLEEAGWDGARFDINPHVARIPSERKSPLFIGDVGTVEMGQRLQGRSFVDYISFDVDGGTLAAIKHFPWNVLRFGCMTFEHDSHGTNFEAKEAMKAALLPLRYQILCEDVCYEDKGLHIFEDWWVDPERVPFAKSVYSPTIQANLRKRHWADLLTLLHELLNT